MEKNFVTVLQQKTGLTVTTGPLFFSPLGRVQGKNLVLAGKMKDKDIDIQIAEYQIRPRENILVELWEKQEFFDVRKLHYDLWLTDVKLANRSEEISIMVEELELGWDETHGQCHVKKLTGTRGADSLYIEDFLTGYVNQKSSITAKELRFTQGTNQFELGLFQVEGQLPEVNFFSTEQKSVHQVMSCIEDLRLVDFQGVMKDKSFSLNGGRLLRIGDQRWSILVQAIFEEFPLAVNAQLELDKDEQWILTGWQDLVPLNKKINYSFNGPCDVKGPWRAVLSDDMENQIEVDVTRSPENDWVGTWLAEMKQIPLLNDQWPAISGRFDGGISWDGHDARFVLKGKRIQGGPGKTREGSLDGLFVFNREQGNLEIKNLVLGENNKWSGNCQALLQLQPLKLEGLKLEVKDFPLGQYSPHVNGDLEIQALLTDQHLDVTVKSKALYPDKDPLQKLENLNVSVQVNDKEVHYRQSFQQNGDENIIQVIALVEQILTDPMRIRDGTLIDLRSSSQLFELKLEESVPVRINLEGVEVQSFSIDDLNLRLRKLKGHAYIPFIMPSRLLIEAKGYLDMEYMPPIGDHRVGGKINIYKARWDRGWSLSNLDVSWRGEKIELKPSGLLEPLTIQLQGSLRNRLIQFDQAQGLTMMGGRVEASGNYHIGTHAINLNLQAEKLQYIGKDYSLNYDSPFFVVSGDPSALALSGNVKVNRFLYSGDFAMMGDQRGLNRQRLETRPPESIDIRNTLDINVLPGGDFQVRNNAAQLGFNLDQLKIHGPVSALRWKGRAIVSKDKSNRVILPFQWLDVSFQTKNLQLVFDDEDTWDPSLHLEGEAQVDGVQVFLTYDDAMSNMGEGLFKLSSSPSYSRKEILSLLGSGEEPVQEVFGKTSGDESAENAGASFTLIKSRARGKEQQSGLNYSAGISSGEAPFEFRVDYRLGQHLGIEATQTATNGVFLGLRYSKQVASLAQLIRRSDLVERQKDQKELPVIWDFTGITFGESLGLESKLRDSLLKVEDVLQRGEYLSARDQMTTVLEDELMNLGYLSAQCFVRIIRQETKLLDRRNTSRRKSIDKIFVQIEFKLGPQWSLSGVQILNWPESVNLPEHPWFKLGRLRAPLVAKSQMDKFKDLLLTTLADAGYPSAQYEQIYLEPLQQVEPESVAELIPEIVQTKPMSDRYKNTIPHQLCIRLDPGQFYRVVQLHVEGTMSISQQKCEEVVGYSNEMVYCENSITQFASRLKQYYEAEGYFGSRIQVSQILKSRQYPRVSVHLKVEEGEKWTINKIQYEGVSSSDLNYLKHVSGLTEGELAHPNRLVKGIAQLSKLPQLMSVSYHWVEVRKGYKNLMIEVKENPAWRFASRIGFQSDRGLQWALRLRRENLFGRGESMAFENNFSEEERQHLIRYEIPDLFLKKWRGQILLGYQVDLISNREIVNKTFVTGTSIYHELDRRSWGYDFIYKEDKNIEGEFPSLRLKSVFRSSAVALAKQPGKGWGYNLKHQLVSYIDSTQFAVIGEYRLSLGFKLGGSMLTPWVKVGNYFPADASFDLPLADRFFLGGTGSLRGFRESSISGPNNRGGESVSSCGAELFYPMFDWIDGSLFYEWGKVYDQSGFRQSDDGRQSIGMGLLFRTPVGPIEGYFAHPLGVDRLGIIGLQLGTIF
jgi:outer membrane translocation and assembly module TamA